MRRFNLTLAVLNGGQSTLVIPDLGHGCHANERSLNVLTTGLGVGLLRVSERDARSPGLVIESNTPRLAHGSARTKSLHVAYSPTLHLEGLPYRRQGL
jgi:hypothetical protein